MARAARQAIEWGRAQIANRTRDWTGYCLIFVRSCFGVGAMYPSAITAWDGAKRKHQTDSPGSIPRGVPVFWRGGKYGHIALSLGNGRCISTDAKRRGWPDVVSIDSVTRSWGYDLLGWTEDLNGQTVWTKPERTTPRITAVLQARTHAKRVAALKALIEHGPARAATAAQKWLDAIETQQAAKKAAAAARAVLEKLEK